MNDMPDGNTAALNAYELEQEKRDREMEINQDDIDMHIEQLVVAAIESNAGVLHDAINGESIMWYGPSDSVNHSDIFADALLEAVKCSGSRASRAADEELGRAVRHLVTDYIVEQESLK